MSDIDNQIRHVFTTDYRRAMQLRPSPQLVELYHMIKGHPSPMTAGEVAAARNITIQHANVLLRRLRLRGYITRSLADDGIEYRYEVTGCN